MTTREQMDAQLDRFEYELETLRPSIDAGDPAAVEHFYTIAAEWDAFAPEVHEAIEAK